MYFDRNIFIAYRLPKTIFQKKKRQQQVEKTFIPNDGFLRSVLPFLAMKISIRTRP